MVSLGKRFIYKRFRSTSVPGRLLTFFLLLQLRSGRALEADAQRQQRGGGVPAALAQRQGRVGDHVDGGHERQAPGHAQFGRTTSNLKFNFFAKSQYRLEPIKNTLLARIFI